MVDKTEPVSVRLFLENGKSVRLIIDGMVKGNVHELKCYIQKGLKGTEQLLQNDVAYYTLNEISKLNHIFHYLTRSIEVENTMGCGFDLLN